jgi:hypothetical protein
MQKTVTIQIPFEVLVDAIASLGLEEKRRLWQLLDREIKPALEKETHEGANISYETSGEVLTLEEMIERYPNQWLLIGEPELDDNANTTRGQVLAYSPDEYEIYNALSLFDVKSKSIEYTGSIPQDLAVLM